MVDQRGNTYCASFCASLPLLAGSGNDTSQAAMVSQWSERAADCNKVPLDVGGLGKGCNGGGSCSVISDVVGG